MDALETGAHVVVEMPATTSFVELEALLRRAEERKRFLIEDYNYVFNRAPQEILRCVESRAFGAVIHVEVLICVDMFDPGGFAGNMSHTSISMPGGAIADFLPHLASLAHAFVGRHRSAHAVWTKRRAGILPHDEFQAVWRARAARQPSASVHARNPTPSGCGCTGNVCRQPQISLRLDSRSMDRDRCQSSFGPS